MAICAPIPMWSGFFTDKAQCMTQCASYAQAPLCCRAQHVYLARDSAEAGSPGDTSMHCGHSTGIDPCPIPARSR